MFKIMGGKSSKKERNEIVEQIRTTIQSGSTSNELAYLANQFQRASFINTDEIITSLSKNYKSYISAVKKNDLCTVIKILTSRKIGINEQMIDKQGRWKLTPLHVAALLGKVDIIRSILSSLEIDLNMISKDGDTPLIIAIKAAANEQICLETVQTLIEDKRCQFSMSNSVGATALSVSVAKGFKSVAYLLVSSNRIHVYSFYDLAMAIKLAVLYDKDELADIIFNEMDRHSKNELINLFGQNPELKSLTRLLSEWENNRQKELQEISATNESATSHNEDDNEDYEEDEEITEMMASSSIEAAMFSPSMIPSSKLPSEEPKQQHKSPQFMVTISTTVETLASKSTKDHFGQQIYIGNIVQILSEDLIRKYNPRLSAEIEFIESIADQKAYIHDIDAEGDMYVDVQETFFSGHINSKCVQFVDTGPRQRLADGKEVAIGYYVKVIDDITKVQQFAKGHGGWKPEMSSFCGKTGKISKIDKDGDVFIHFPNARHCLNPKSLVASSTSELQAKDVNGNWMSKGSFVKVTPNEMEFKHLHEEICQEYEDKYKKLLGSLVKIYKLRLFNQYCDAIAYIGPICYYLNPKCVQVVQPKDINGQEICIGDLVLIKSSDHCDLVSGRLEQQLVGQIGTVVDIEVNDEELITKVQISDRRHSGVYYLSPKILQKKRKSSSSSSPEGNNSNGKSQPPPMSKRSSPRSDSSSNSTATSNSEDTGYGSSSQYAFEEIGHGSARNERKCSSASILSSAGSCYVDGLQIIARKDLEMKRKLGEGGFGCVTTGSWRGTDCAIKQIRPVVTSDMNYDDILKEARIQYGLKHPNIVQLYGISYENDLWMVMQLVNGMDLHSVLFKTDANGNKEKIAYGFKIKICVQTTNAITFLHEKGFLHSDIKPENILVEKKTGNVFICDFGITRYLGPNLDIRSYSQKYTENFSGTIQYIAPECFQKDPIEKKYRRPTFKSDIWALGAVFIELFTEKDLFPNEKALFECKIMNNYTGVKSFLKTIADTSIRTMLKRSIDPAPDNRPTAIEMNRIFFNIMRSK